MTDVHAPAPCLHHGKPPQRDVYTGVTSNLVQRAYAHRTGAGDGFASRHRCVLLVWFELHGDMPSAITCEKQIKGGSRAKKPALIEAANGGWRDLYPDLVPTMAAVAPVRDTWLASLRSQ